MSEADFNRSVRHERKRKKQTATVCQHCGESDIRAICRDGICYECVLRQKGKSVMEKHHVAGRHNDEFTIPIRANAHAIISDYQNDFPANTLRNPLHDVLHQVAAWLRGLGDIFRYLAELLPKWAKTFEDLCAFLNSRLGSDWWNQFSKWRVENAR